MDYFWTVTSGGRRPVACQPSSSEAMSMPFSSLPVRYTTPGVTVTGPVGLVITSGERQNHSPGFIFTKASLSIGRAVCTSADARDSRGNPGASGGGLE